MSSNLWCNSSQGVVDACFDGRLDDFQIVPGDVSIFAYDDIKSLESFISFGTNIVAEVCDSGFDSRSVNFPLIT